MNVITETRRAQ